MAETDVGFDSKRSSHLLPPSFPLFIHIQRSALGFCRFTPWGGEDERRGEEFGDVDGEFYRGTGS